MSHVKKFSEFLAEYEPISVRRAELRRTERQAVLDGDEAAEVEIEAAIMFQDQAEASVK
jgi:hypothetical protein